jgi:exopolysaccharide biosynthesis polyprenyl glycosylphosphotransferase
MTATAIAVWLTGVILQNLPGSAGETLALDRGAVALLLILQPLALGIFGAYGPARKITQAGRLLKAALAAGLLTYVHPLLSGAPVASLTGVALIIYCAWAGALILGGRVALARAVAYAYARGFCQRKALVVGSAEDAARVAELVTAQRTSNVRIVGRLSPTGTRDLGSMGTVAELEPAIRSTGADAVIVSADLSFEALETFVRRCFEAGATVSILPRHLHRFSTRLEIRRTPNGAMLDLFPQGLRLPQFAIKRLMDIVISAAILIATLPILAFIALAIKLDSPGPVLFKQRRCGIGGRPFYMYKFRTMVADADRMKKELQHLNESGDPRLFKIKRDPRITRVGRWLRRTSLDELPQLFNVLKGEMSLVGPRPFFPEDLASYEPHHFERLSVLPGITGLWQVSGRSDIVDFEEVVRLDTAYIRDWSISRDLWILVRTLPAALGRGAY